MNQHPQVALTKQEVVSQKLESYMLSSYPDMMSFKEWWKSVEDVVQVKSPHERHGLAGQLSNHAMPDVMSDFLQFIDANSEPNGCQTGTYHAQYFLSTKFTRVNPPRQGENYLEKIKRSVVAESNRAQEECGRGTCGKTAANEWLSKHRPKVALCPHMTLL